METLLTIILAWIVVSIPVSLLVGRFIAGRRSDSVEVSTRAGRPWVAESGFEPAMELTGQEVLSTE